MAENKDNSAKSDEQKLADLEKQITDKAAEKSLSAEAATKVKPETKSSPTPPNTDKKITLEEKAVVTETSKKVTSPEKFVAAPASSSSAPAKTQKNTAEKKVKTGLVWLVTLINLIFLILLIGAAYWGWQQ